VDTIQVRSPLPNGPAGPDDATREALDSVLLDALVSGGPRAVRWDLRSGSDSTGRVPGIGRPVAWACDRRIGELSRVGRVHEQIGSSAGGNKLETTLLPAPDRVVLQV